MERWKARWRRARRSIGIARREPLLLARAWSYLVQIEIRLRLQGWERTRRWADAWVHGHRGEEPAADPTARAHELASLVAIAAWGLPFASCLRRSLLLWMLLGRERIPSEIRVGMRRGERAAFEAHAWVTHQERPLNERHDVGAVFSTFDRPLLR